MVAISELCIRNTFIELEPAVGVCSVQRSKSAPASKCTDRQDVEQVQMSGRCKPASPRRFDADDDTVSTQVPTGGRSSGGRASVTADTSHDEWGFRTEMPEEDEFATSDETREDEMANFFSLVAPQTAPNMAPHMVPPTVPQMAPQVFQQPPAETFGPGQLQMVPGPVTEGNTVEIDGKTYKKVPFVGWHGPLGETVIVPLDQLPKQQGFPCWDAATFGTTPAAVGRVPASPPVPEAANVAVAGARPAAAFWPAPTAAVQGAPVPAAAAAAQTATGFPSSFSSSSAPVSDLAAAVDHVESQSLTRVPVVQSAICVDYEGRQVYRISWTLDSRKWHSKDREAVSPAFNGPPSVCGQQVPQFKMILRPKAASEGRGGASFKSSKGKGMVLVRCLDQVTGNMNPNVTYRITCGEETRGPVTRNISTNTTSGPGEDKAVWDFSRCHKRSTFVISLEFILEDRSACQ